MSDKLRWKRYETRPPNADWVEIEPGSYLIRDGNHPDQWGCICPPFRMQQLGHTDEYIRLRGIAYSR
jgi:hypothetical protein